MRKFDNTIEFDAAEFFWGTLTGVTDASDLRLKAGEEPFVQVYNDACDAGMTLVNLKRGTRCDFILTEVIYHPEDRAKLHALEWRFKSVDTSGWSNSQAKEIEVTIFND